MGRTSSYLLLLFLLGILESVRSSIPDDVAGLRAEFAAYLEKHEKVYHDLREWEARLANYVKAKRFIEDFNRARADAAEPPSFHLRLNHLSDLHDHELTGNSTPWTLHNKLRVISPAEELMVLSSEPPPESLNWASHNNPLKRPIVTAPQNQRHCGACWAFVATTVVESAVAATTGRLTPLSVQQLVDCDTRWNAGCLGGNPIQAYDYIESSGLADAETYPYVAEKRDCPARLTPVSAIRTYRLLRSYDEDSLMAAVAKQPVAVGIAGQYASFLYYAGGVYDDNGCGTDLNHAVVIVGYGNDEKTGKSYWLAKNSWGDGWGEQGFVRLLRQSVGPGVCGLATAPSVPIGAYGGNVAGLAHRIKGYDGGADEGVQWPTLGQLLPALIAVSLMVGMAAGYLVSIRAERSRMRRRGGYRPIGDGGHSGGYGIIHHEQTPRHATITQRPQPPASSTSASSSRSAGHASFPPALVVLPPTHEDGSRRSAAAASSSQPRTYGSINP